MVITARAKNVNWSFTFLYKIQYNLVALPFPSELSLKSSYTRKLPWCDIQPFILFDAYKYSGAFFGPMYVCVEQSSIYCRYGSAFVRVFVHSQILSVITYWVLSSLLTAYCHDLAYMLLVINRLKIKSTRRNRMLCGGIWLQLQLGFD